MSGAADSRPARRTPCLARLSPRRLAQPSRYRPDPCARTFAASAATGHRLLRVRPWRWHGIGLSSAAPAWRTARNKKKESLNDASILQLACALFPCPGLPRPGAAGQSVRPGGDLHRTARPRDPGPGHRPAYQRARVTAATPVAAGGSACDSAPRFARSIPPHRQSACAWCCPNNGTARR